MREQQRDRTRPQVYKMKKKASEPHVLALAFLRRRCSTKDEAPPFAASTCNEVDRPSCASLSSQNGPPPARGKWSSKADFIFGCISYAVGLGNVWRFPYLCYENGGGAFLVPYFICFITTAIPMFYLEVALGQYLSRGGIGIWSIVPMFKGVGIASLIIVTFCNIYYMVIVAWILFYLVSSFTEVLPWMHCSNYWNTNNCWEHNDTQLTPNNSVTPIVEFWE
ncbi:hypothetical protein HPB48_003281 [Haemaphysalis longicornis]|uniref:Transporter n=1 Tax=Haemaphysalis longicornis TaxID=44386 RepID=A0A9J6H3T9_HAELO|nr:hypothetical protein HPB48_003281 [Haemaphysalis longicornis]